MPTVFKLIDFDSERVAHLFNRATAKAKDFSIPFAEIGEDAMIAEQQLVASRGRRGGGSWAGLTYETIRKKGNAELLYTEGSRPNYSDLGHDALYKSVAHMGAPFQIFRVTPKSLEFGTEVPEARFVQSGTRRAPARPFFKFTQRDRERWMNILLRHAMEPFMRSRA